MGRRERTEGGANEGVAVEIGGDGGGGGAGETGGGAVGEGGVGASVGDMGNHGFDPENNLLNRAEVNGLLDFQTGAGAGFMGGIGRQ